MFSVFFVFFFKQKTSYELLIIDWISDVCSSDLVERRAITPRSPPGQGGHQQSRAHADGDDHAARWCPARHQRPAPAASRAGPSTSASSSRNRADSSTPVDTSPYHAASKRSVASRSEEHTSALQSLMRTSYDVFRLKKKTSTHMNSLHYCAHILQTYAKD